MLSAAVEEAFERTARGLVRWDDPHPPPDRVVADEEYSRVTDPGRWRIIGARVDAWLDVLVADGRVTVDRDVPVRWVEAARTVVARLDRVQPVVPGGLALIVGRSRIGDVADAGVTLGVGDPAAFVHAVPDCGCDACDSGSADVIDEIDMWLGGIVDGSFRHLSGPLGTITVITDGVRRASGRYELPTSTGSSRWRFMPGPTASGGADDVGDRDGRPRARRPFDVDAVLADPVGWREWSGPSWLA